MLGGSCGGMGNKRDTKAQGDWNGMPVDGEACTKIDLLERVLCVSLTGR